MTDTTQTPLPPASGRGIKLVALLAFLLALANFVHLSTGVKERIRSLEDAQKSSVSAQKALQAVDANDKRVQLTAQELRSQMEGIQAELAQLRAENLRLQTENQRSQMVVETAILESTRVILDRVVLQSIDPVKAQAQTVRNELEFLVGMLHASPEGTPEENTSGNPAPVEPSGEGR